MKFNERAEFSNRRQNYVKNILKNILLKNK